MLTHAGFESGRAGRGEICATTRHVGCWRTVREITPWPLLPLGEPRGRGRDAVRDRERTSEPASEGLSRKEREAHVKRDVPTTRHAPHVITYGPSEASAFWPEQDCDRGLGPLGSGEKMRFILDSVFLRNEAR